MEKFTGTGVTALQLRALVLAEDQGSGPSINTVAHKHTQLQLQGT